MLRVSVSVLLLLGAISALAQDVYYNIRGGIKSSREY